MLLFTTEIEKKVIPTIEIERKKKINNSSQAT